MTGQADADAKMALIIQNDAKYGWKYIYIPSAQITTLRKMMRVITHKLHSRVH